MILSGIANKILNTSFSERFPGGCCGDVSVALGVYLESKGFNNILYAYDESGHAWIEIEDVVIDITCGQFNDCEGPIISKNSSWHSQRSIKGKKSYMDFYNPEWSDDLRTLLQLPKDNITTNKSI